MDLYPPHTVLEWFTGQPHQQHLSALITTTAYHHHHLNVTTYHYHKTMQTWLTTTNPPSTTRSGLSHNNSPHHQQCQQQVASANVPATPSADGAVKAKKKSWTTTANDEGMTGRENQEKKGHTNFPCCLLTILNQKTTAKEKKAARWEPALTPLIHLLTTSGKSRTHLFDLIYLLLD